MRCPRCGDQMRPGPPTWAGDVCDDCQVEFDSELAEAEQEHQPLTEASIDSLIERSSVGAALADIEARGIEAHLADVERESKRGRR